MFCYNGVTRNIVPGTYVNIVHKLIRLCVAKGRV